MKKIKGILILILSLLVLYFGIYGLQNIILTKSYVEYNEGQGGDSSIRCNGNIFKPEFATVFGVLNEGHIGFKNTNMFVETHQDGENSYIGGTTVKNTDLKTLLKMVKDDCYQFQKSNSIELGSKESAGIYSKAESKEKKEKRKLERLKRKAEKERKKKEMLNNMSEEERKAYEIEQERLKNRTEEGILRDKGYSEEEIKKRMNIQWKEINIR